MPPLKDPTGLVIGNVRIDFANPKGFFYPGEKVAGKVFIRLDHVIQCKKLMLICVGERRAEFETGSDDTSQTHRNIEVYFYESKVVLGPQPPAKDIFINTDQINYEFKFQLPNNLPPSAFFVYPGTGASSSVLYTIRILIVTHPKEKLDSTSNIQKWIGFEHFFSGKGTTS